MKKKLLLFLMILIMPVGVLARAKTLCNYSILSSLKQKASNVNVIYDYVIDNNEAIFTVTINNLTPDIYIVDGVTGNTYNYGSTNNGELVIGGYKNIEKLKYNITSNVSECKDELLLSQYITLPVYNKYSADPICDGINDLALCYKFYKTNATYEEVVEAVEKHKIVSEEKEEKKEKHNVTKTDWEKIMDYVLDYGVYVIAFIAILITIISIRRSRKNRFDFKL